MTQDINLTLSIKKTNFTNSVIYDNFVILPLAKIHTSNTVNPLVDKTEEV